MEMKLIIILFFVVKISTIGLCQRTIWFDTIQLHDITVNKQRLLYENKKVAELMFGRKYKKRKEKNYFTKDTEIIHDYGANSITLNRKGLVVGFHISTNNYLFLGKFRTGQSKLIDFKPLFPYGYHNFANYGGNRFLKVAIKGQDDTFIIFSFESEVLVNVKIWYDY